MRPEGQHQNKGRQRRRYQQPRAEPAPACMGAVAELADDRIIDGVPETTDKHQYRYGTHADTKGIGIENHEKVADKHPAEVATYISHAIGKLAQQGKAS